MNTKFGSPFEKLLFLSEKVNFFKKYSWDFFPENLYLSVFKN
jgi:hypothetical protein